MARRRRSAWPVREVEDRPTDAYQLADAINVRNAWTTVLVVDTAPSGKRYRFEPGEVKRVPAGDGRHLLSLTMTRAGCCGAGQQPTHYFEEVP